MTDQTTIERKKVFIGGAGWQEVMFEGEWKAANRPGNLIRMEQELHTPTMRFRIRHLMTWKEFQDLRDYRQPPIRIVKICGIGTDGAFDENAAPANVVALPECTVKMGEAEKKKKVKASIFKRGVAVLLNTGTVWVVPESKVENLPEATRNSYRDILKGEADDARLNSSIQAMQRVEKKAEVIPDLLESAREAKEKPLEWAEDVVRRLDLDDEERKVREAVKRCGSMNAAAKDLKIPFSTLRRIVKEGIVPKMVKAGITPERCLLLRPSDTFKKSPTGEIYKNGADEPVMDE